MRRLCMGTGLALPMMIERGGEFRWRVVSPDGLRRSASWRVWTARNSPDIYVAQRHLAGTMKISLHADGNFHAGFVSNEVSKSWQGDVPGGSRHLDKWLRSAEFRRPAGRISTKSSIPNRSFAPSKRADSTVSR